MGEMDAGVGDDVDTRRSHRNDRVVAFEHCSGFFCNGRQLAGELSFGFVGVEGNFPSERGLAFVLALAVLGGDGDLAGGRDFCDGRGCIGVGDGGGDSIAFRDGRSGGGMGRGSRRGRGRLRTALTHGSDRWG